ncbi:prolyl oligopeptidase family serine peptidase [Stenotrophomonas sp. HITSZ_GD]|uniref:alpha/beta hydrolase family protein n=1 Tax=Stenotrophomonas sp. HITSZ_GD TaxID=3037248 RepID=UPI00240E1326|nr:prolyl oligopeptidase family serine peptidase [Stenotrophomonas sp. HITSZ_GD]MDG2527013.1 prolyl oligopeptidase family serine peptidase [Stenotrophomonas sp. HITSZ_GD]
MGNSVVRAARTWCALLCVFAFVAPAMARMQLVKPGEMPVLAPDEGMVLMAVDTSQTLERVTLNKDGQVFGAGVMTQIQPGRSYRLYVAPVGDYAWKKITVASNASVWFGFNLEDSEEFRFRVEPGRITYPGDLLFRPTGVWRADTGMVNRALAAMDWLQAQHPGLQQVPFAYSGHYPDPFPAFYRQVQATHNVPASEPVLAAPPAPGKLPVAADVLLRPGRLRAAYLNPRGDLLAMETWEGKDKWQIELIDLLDSTRTVLATSVTPFDDVRWSGSDALLFSARVVGGHLERVLRTTRDAGGKRRWSVIQLPSGGTVLDVLDDQPDLVLYVSFDSHGDPLVRYLPIGSQALVDADRPRMRDRLNVGLTDDVNWMADGRGQLRLATVKRDDDYVLMHRRGGEYSEVMRFADMQDFEPVALSYEGEEIYAITDKDRGQRDLVAYDIASRKITRTLFSKPGVDVKAPIFGPRREVVGVRYYRDGHLLSEYFGAGDARLAESLRAAMPDRNVVVVDRSRDGQQAVVWVDAGDQPGQLYHLDVQKHTMALLAEDRLWLEKVPLAPTRLVSYRSRDGLPLQAFLTLPAGQGKRPLVVMPHGGPIGVADSLAFDAETQFLASLGYAVLRVNFRGSEGYGRAFREAGKAGFGTLIEDDIDLAINKVLAEQPVDGQRMCVVGGSYGGYSSLVMAMRWPERFRCVGSIAGVSDRILLYTASDSGRTAKLRAELERYLGDPRTEAAQMQDTSPLYHYERIKTPVLLAHGLEDRRVDYEHMRRMQRLLVAGGNTPVGMTFEKAGHGFDEDDEIRLWTGVAGFLQAHLEAAPAKPASGAP